MDFKIIAFVILNVSGLIALGDDNPLDGNDSCTTDKSFAGYNHFYFPNRDEFTFRYVYSAFL